MDDAEYERALEAESEAIEEYVAKRLSAGASVGVLSAVMTDMSDALWSQFSKMVRDSQGPTSGKVH